jgi:carbonic anhydrase
MTVTDEFLQGQPDLRRGRIPRPAAAAAGAPGRHRGVHGRPTRPAKVFGFAEGDAHVIRNAGGAVTADAEGSLAISQRLLGTREIILVHHTDCGMLTFSDDEFRAGIEAETGQRPHWAAEAFANVEADVRQSLTRVRNSPFIPHRNHVRGFIYDVESGSVTEVV